VSSLVSDSFPESNNLTPALCMWSSSDIFGARNCAQSSNRKPCFTFIVDLVHPSVLEFIYSRLSSFKSSGVVTFLQINISHVLFSCFKDENLSQFQIRNLPSRGWGKSVSELLLPADLLLIPQMIYEYEEPLWNDIGREKPMNSEKNQSQCHFVHKSHMD
jgi:hypothetical protein